MDKYWKEWEKKICNAPEPEPETEPIQNEPNRTGNWNKVFNAHKEMKNDEIENIFFFHHSTFLADHKYSIENCRNFWARHNS